MTKSELVNLIEKTTNEVFETNKDNIKDYHLPGIIELAVKLSCLTNFKILQELGILEDFTTQDDL